MGIRRDLEIRRLLSLCLISLILFCVRAFDLSALFLDRDYFFVVHI